MLAALLASDFLTTNSYLPAKLLLALTSTVILGYKFHRTPDHILLSGSKNHQTHIFQFMVALLYSL
jgi:hypothetical protein